MPSLPISFDEAVSLITDAIPIPSLVAVTADRDDPALDKSLMDGVAVCFNYAIKEAVIKGSIFAGDDASLVCLKQGEGVRIMTGAVIPRGCDAVIPVEYCTFEGNRCLWKDEILSGANIQRQASYAKKGSLLFEKDRPLTIPIVALLAHVGSPIPVRPRITCMICSTGSELAIDPSPYQIRDSNGVALEFLTNQLGFASHRGPTLPDEPEAVSEILNTFTEDILLCSGGVSAGEKDYLPKMIKELGGQILFHKVNIKPGMPVIIAQIRNQWIVGLPGNPMSSYLDALLFLPLIASRLKGFDYTYPWKESVLLEDYEHKGVRELFSPGKISSQGLTVLRYAGSSDLVTFAKANCFIRLNESVPRGTRVRYLDIF